MKAKNISVISVIYTIAFITIMNAPIAIYAQQNQKISQTKDVNSDYKGWEGDPDSLTVFVDPSLNNSQKDSVDKAIKRWNNGGCKPKLKPIISDTAKVKITIDNTMPDTIEGRCSRWSYPPSTKYRKGLIRLRSNPTSVPFGELVTHEIGHLFGLKDTRPSGYSNDVMRGSGSNGNGELSAHDSSELKASNAMHAMVAIGAINHPMAIINMGQHPLDFNVGTYYPPAIASVTTIIATPVANPFITIDSTKIVGSIVSVYISVMPEHWTGMFYIDIQITAPTPYPSHHFLGYWYISEPPVPPMINYTCSWDYDYNDPNYVITWITNNYDFPREIRAQLLINDSIYYDGKGDGAFVVSLYPGNNKITLLTDDYGPNNASYTNYIFVPTEISENTIQQTNISFFPNPAKDYCKITAPTNSTHYIYNAQVKMVSTLYGTTIWSCKNVGEGLYFIITLSENRHYYSKIIVAK